MQNLCSIGILILLTHLMLLNDVRADQSSGLIDTTSACVDAKAFKCDGNCDDGFGLDCYYDSRSTKIESGSSLYTQRNKCYGFYDMSRCNPCRNEFNISGKKLNCEAFYSGLNDFNKNCGNCLRKISEYAG